MTATQPSIRTAQQMWDIVLVPAVRPIIHAQRANPPIEVPDTTMNRGRLAKACFDLFAPGYSDWNEWLLKNPNYKPTPIS